MTPIRPELTTALSAYQTRAQVVLTQAMPSETQAPIKLHQAMRYAVLGGGKRIRPMLVYATGHALGASLDTLDSSAAAVEIIHAYSLIHDDLPAMDNDHLRRGLPTCHIAFGEATAILAGDALQALAFECIARDINLATHPQTQVDMLAVLAHACGSLGMAGGQAFDLEAVGKQIDALALERMHVYKTGALIRASVRLGALASHHADTELLSRLEHFGHCVGLAFQIRDDILDIEGETHVIGKQQGADIALGKPTYPSIVGLARSRDMAEVLRESAIAAIAPLGNSGAQLIDLAHYAVDRSS